MTRITVDEIHDGQLMWSWTLYPKDRWRKLFVWLFKHGAEQR